MEDLVSIIVPTFNNESSIHAHLRSLLKQTYKNIEIIILDGYSTDNTLNIIKIKYSKEKRIKILQSFETSFNNRYSYVLNNSKGKYIIFSSPNIIYSLNYIEYAIKIIQKTKSEIFSCDFFEENENILNRPFQINISQPKEKITIKNNNQYINSLCNKSTFKNHIYLWNKLINKSILRNIDKSDNQYFYSYNILKQANTITISNQKLIMNVLVDIFYDYKCFSTSDFEIIVFIEKLLSTFKSEKNNYKKFHLSSLMLHELLKIRKKLSFYHLDLSIEDIATYKFHTDLKFNSLYKYFIKHLQTTDTEINKICNDYITELQMEKERIKHPLLYNP